MIASEHCGDSVYDTQYHYIKTNMDHTYKQESDMLLHDHSNSSPALVHGSLSSSQKLTDLASPQCNSTKGQRSNNYAQALWNQKYPTNSDMGMGYSMDNDLFYANLPPPPGHLLPASPSSLPRYNQLVKRSHPRHHSANGILQQNSHHDHSRYHQPMHQGYNITAQRRLSSSMVSYNNSSTTDTTVSSLSSSSSTSSSTPWSTTMHQHPNLSQSSYSSLSSLSPTGSAFSSLSPTSALKQPQHTNIVEPSSSPTPLRYQVLLQASTAAAQKYGESSSLTYLNRGQAYGLHFQDHSTSSKTSTLITSTISITFHEAAHRLASQNYWRFWLSQQDHPNEARALDLDIQQSSGLVNVYYPSFDTITIQWQSHVGATLFVRFNCLSTDFSRIKGVKGIPLRALVESVATPSSDGDLVPYKEKSFCKIKLFRDKGAERKSKDDAKQISKQLEKMKADGNPLQNPLWHFYSRPILPHSLFEPLLEEDEIAKEDLSLMPSSTSLSPSSSPPRASSAAISSTIALTAAPISTLPVPTVASSIITSPAAYDLTSSTLSSAYPLTTSPLSSSVSTVSTSHVLADGNRNHYQQHDNGMVIMSSFYPPTFSCSSQMSSSPTPSSLGCSPLISPSLPLSSLGYGQHQTSSKSSPFLGMKRSRSHVVASALDHSSSEDQSPPMKKHQGTRSSLTLFVDTKKHQSSSPDLKRIDLDVITVQQLIIKLSALFSLQANSVTEVLWRRDPTSNKNSTELQHRQKKTTTSNQSSSSQVLVLVEDCVLETFRDRTVMNVKWEIISNGMVRFILNL
ncbi:CP2 transcription factor-domain-containing protein [Chlamydoabsidia padenii]|nr:CP2 transcription factor-domain-containing protein [Chlamydoabsidia padenii]